MSILLPATCTVYVRNLSLVKILFYKMFYIFSATSFDVLKSMFSYNIILYILIFKERTMTFYKVRYFEHLSLFIKANRETKTL